MRCFFLAHGLLAVLSVELLDSGTCAISACQAQARLIIYGACIATKHSTTNRGHVSCVCCVDLAMCSSARAHRLSVKKTICSGETIISFNARQVLHGKPV